ncbi:MAG: hypothetical protein ACR5LF_13960 [Symbiopectobacterium sp.]
MFYNGSTSYSVINLSTISGMHATRFWHACYTLVAVFFHLLQQQRGKTLLGVAFSPTQGTQKGIYMSEEITQPTAQRTGLLGK